MRVTRNIMLTNVISSLNDVQRKLFKNQMQISESRRVLSPSDDPVSTNRILFNKATLAKNEQYQKNVQGAMNWLEVTEGTLAQMNSVLSDISILTNKGATDSYGSHERHVLAKELNSQLEELINIASTTFHGRHIFSGVQTKTDPFMTSNEVVDESFTAAFNTEIELNHVHIESGSVTITDASGAATFTEGADFTVDYENGIITVLDTGSMVDGQDYLIDYSTESFSSITPNSKGINGEINYQVGENVTLQVNVEGDVLFTKKVDIFNKLIELRNKIERDDIEGIQNLMSDLETASDHVTSINGEVGAKISRLTATDEFLGNEQIVLQKIKSEEEDLDVAEALVNLQALELAYQTALTANSEIIKTNLMNLLSL